MADPQLKVTYATAADFLAAHDAEMKVGGLMVHGAKLSGVSAMAPCTVEVRVAGGPPVTVPAKVAAVMEEVGVAVMFDGMPEPLAKLAESLRSG